MKLRKILCLSLAAAVTFTTTISLTASAEIGGESASENQSFGSAILDELFSDSENSSDTGNNDNGGISPLWNKDDHDKTIDYDAVNWSASQRQIMKDCSYWADRYFKASGGSVATVPALHGAGNYVANLEFLWYFAIFLGRQNTTTDKAIQNAKNSAINKIKNTTAYTNRNSNHLQNLINNSSALVKFNGKTYDTNLTASKMKIRILGYAAHLVGDVYAHRTIIPSISGFNTSYFKTTFKTDVSKGIVAFRDLKNYSNGTLTTQQLSEKYTDKIDFYPNRFKDAKDNVSNLLTHNSATFDEFAFLCPNRTNVKLEDFKKFIKQCGISTSYLPDSEWSKYST